MFKHKKKQKVERLNGKAPQWFKDWDNQYFRRVDSRSKRNEKLIYAIFAAVVGLNTVGNWYHEDIMNFFFRLFGAE